MSSGSKKRHKQDRSKKHVRIYWHEKESEAWKHASLGERCLYIELKYRYSGFNNGYISMSQREAAELLGVRAHTAGKYFDGLIDKGFVAITQDSAFNMKRTAREWRITELPCDRTGWPPTKDYRRWQPKAKFNAQCRKGTQAVSDKRTMEKTPNCYSDRQGHYSADKPQEASVANRHTVSIPRGGGATGVEAREQSATIVSFNRQSNAGDAPFGQRVREARQAKGLSVAALAAHAGIGRSTLSNVGAGRYRAGADTQLAILEALDGPTAAGAEV